MTLSKRLSLPNVGDGSAPSQPALSRIARRPRPTSNDGRFGLVSMRIELLRRTPSALTRCLKPSSMRGSITATKRSCGNSSPSTSSGEWTTQGGKVLRSQGSLPSENRQPVKAWLMTAIRIFTQGAVGGVAAGVALVLAALGVYGVIAFMVATRTREIGVRVARGAARARVLGEVLGDALKSSCRESVAAVRWVRVVDPSWYPLGGVEPLVYSLAAATSFFVAVLAGIPSARRAAAVQPIVAIRSELGACERRLYRKPIVLTRRMGLSLTGRSPAARDCRLRHSASTC
jgi:hypothetical protein